MKKNVILLLAVLLTVNVFAQAPEKMSYQAVIRNSSDALITNTEVGMQISILQGSASGTAVYVETQTPTSNANGLVSIEIGAGTSTYDFSAIDWATGTYFIKTETDPEGGTNYTITGVSQLLSVPYALHAKTAESVSGGITETDPVFTAWDKSSGISITESQISDFGTYLESEVDGSVTNEIQDLQLLGNILTITQNGSATEIDLSPYLDNTDTQLTEAEVDDMVANNGYLTNETQNLDQVLTQSNSAGNKKISDLSNPTEAQDAVTKAYVDELMDIFEANGMVVVDFSASSTDINTGSSVTFTDNSALNTTTWQWDFGDGNTSTEENPTHTYSSAGTYTVSLTASNGTLSYTKTKNDYITVTDVPQVGSFTDARDGNVYQYVTIGNQVWMSEN